VYNQIKKPVVKEETLWKKTVTELKAKMLADEYVEGAKFASLSDLSREYGISKITALRVVSELEKLGLVKRIPRRGTFIVGRPRNRAIKVALDFQKTWDANVLPIIWKYIAGVEAACRKVRYNMQMVSLGHVASNPNPDDRYILLAADPEKPAYLEFSNKHCPHVFLHSASRLTAHDCIRVNHRTGGRIMTQHMIDAGHTSIAYVGGRASSEWHGPRLRGYLEALEERGLPLDVRLVGEIGASVPEAQGARPEVERLLSLPNPPTAIVASDDLRALSIIACLEKKGLSVPGDLAVSGMDARVEALERALPLTTCDWQLEQQGEIAVDFLVYPPSSGKGPREIVVEPRLVPGKTA